MFSQGLFCSQNVLSKEIKYEMRGVFLSLHDFDFNDKNFDVVKFKNYIKGSYDTFKENGFNSEIGRAHV